MEYDDECWCMGCLQEKERLKKSILTAISIMEDASVYSKLDVYDIPVGLSDALEEALDALKGSTKKKLTGKNTKHP